MIKKGDLTCTLGVNTYSLLRSEELRRRLIETEKDRKENVFIDNMIKRL